MSTPPEADLQGADERIDRSSASIGELVAEVGRNLTELLRQEVELAKAEARQSVSRAGKGAGMLGGAGFAGYLAVLFASVAVWWGLGNAIGRGWSAVVVAVVWALIAAVLALMGRREVQSVRGLPRTVETAKKIPAAVRGDEEAAR
jgi:hypothetical protein